MLLASGDADTAVSVLLAYMRFLNVVEAGAQDFWYQKPKPKQIQLKIWDLG